MQVAHSGEHFSHSCILLPLEVYPASQVALHVESPGRAGTTDQFSSVFFIRYFLAVFYQHYSQNYFFFVKTPKAVTLSSPLTEG
jgi:hypothetical protein